MARATNGQAVDVSHQSSLDRESLGGLAGLPFSPFAGTPETSHWRYTVFAFAIVATAAGLRAAFLAPLETRLAFVTFYPAVVLAALYGGFWAGALATMLSTLVVAYFWLEPTGQFFSKAPVDLLGCAVFVASSFLVSWCIEGMHRALARARKAEIELLAQHDHLETQVKARTAELEQEVAERKRAEAILGEAQRIANVGSWERDLNSGEVRWSDQTYRIFGEERSKFKPTYEGFLARVHPDDRQCVADTVAYSKAYGKRFAIEYRVIPRGGTPRVVLDTGEVVLGEDGRTQYFIGTVKDITERKAAELALWAAKAEAERANQAKSRFLAAASHDLRQPLTALAFYAATFRKTAAPDDLPLVSDMQSCVGNLSALLTDLLDLSKLDAGAVAPQITNLSISELLASLVAAHRPVALAKGLRLHCVDSSLVARTDAVLFRRMVANLLDNAIRYTERGSVLIGCRRRGGRAWIQVWDTGIGIPEDKTSEIFEEFKQLGEPARNRGSGLGLAIVAKTAALLGLQVQVESRLGKGSMFALEMPLGTTPSPLPKRQVQCRPLRIGLVEDHDSVRQAIVSALATFGHDVVAAATSGQLHDRLGLRPPDIVISDYRLAEGETGFDVIASVRTAFGEELPGIVITGNTEAELLRSMACRGVIVLHKPLEPDALQECIADLVQLERLTAP